MTIQARSQFHLQQHVDHLYTTKPRQFAFNARTVDEYTAWKTAFRRKLYEILGISGRVLPDAPHAERLHALDRGDYTEEKYALSVGEGVETPIYVLIPKTPPPYKPIMVFHGHSISVQPVIGNYPNDEAAAYFLSVDENHAQALARAGYLVCAVEQRAFGERITDQLHQPDVPTSCRHLAFEYLMHGRTLLGERCWDGMVAISYVQNRSDVIPNTLGCTGNSGGGTTTLWLTALDDRITVNVPGCYFCSFKASILGMEHCTCNYVPGILEYAEMGDLAALIAPRPLRFINGENDPIYPVTGAREQFETVLAAYTLLNAEERCSLAVHPGAHAYNHAFSQEWFAKWL